MFGQNIQKLKSNYKNLSAIITVIIGLFLIVLIVFFIVSTENKLKEGRYIGQDIEARPTISVIGTGEVYAKPDLALINFSTITEAKTVGEAMSQNTEKMNKIIGFIKEQGVEDKDLKTTSFTIYPRYEYRREDLTESSYIPSSKRVLVGYEVTQQLEVKIRDLDKVGQIIEVATNAGANQVGNLQFTIDDEDKLKKEAREEAVKEAKAKAKELASQLGVKLMRITNFSESGISPRFYGYESTMEMLPAGLGGGAPEIETGENKITVTVTITYEIN